MTALNSRFVHPTKNGISEFRDREDVGRAFASAKPWQIEGVNLMVSAMASANGIM
jgi:hypothetical protein